MMKLTRRMNNITGKRFGRLIALKPLYINKRGNVVWEFQCDCGNKKNINNSSVLNGLTKSCGCLMKEFYQPHIQHRREYESPLHEYRVAKGWTVLELTKKSGVSYSLIGQLATGEVSPVHIRGDKKGQSKQSCIDLAITLNVDFSDLFPRYSCKIGEKYKDFTEDQLLYISGCHEPITQENKLLEKEFWYNIKNNCYLTKKQIIVI